MVKHTPALLSKTYPTASATISGQIKTTTTVNFQTVKDMARVQSNTAMADSTKAILKMTRRMGLDTSRTKIIYSIRENLKMISDTGMANYTATAN